MGVTGMVGTTHTAEKLCPRLWALESHASPRGHWHLPTLSPCCSLGGGPMGTLCSGSLNKAPFSGFPQWVSRGTQGQSLQAESVTLCWG